MTRLEYSLVPRKCSQKRYVCVQKASLPRYEIVVAVDHFQRHETCDVPPYGPVLSLLLAFSQVVQDRPLDLLQQVYGHIARG